MDEIAGGRAAFQLRSLRYLWQRAGEFDVVLAQEMLRGALNATVVGAVKGVPVVTYMGISPIEFISGAGGSGAKSVRWRRSAASWPSGR